MKHSSGARQRDENFELRCALLAALLRSDSPLTEEEAAARFGVTVDAIGELLDAFRRRGWVALVPPRRRRRPRFR